MEDKDHRLLMSHDKKLSEHETRINDLSSKLNDTLTKVEESNKYLREQNNDILQAIIKGNERHESNKHEYEMLNRQQLWKFAMIALGSSSVVYLIIDKIFGLINF